MMMMNVEGSSLLINRQNKTKTISREVWSMKLNKTITLFSTRVSDDEEGNGGGASWREQDHNQCS